MGKRTGAAEAVPNEPETEIDLGAEGLGIDETSEFIQPPSDLRKKVRTLPQKNGDPDPIAAAEAALRRMEASFDGWMEAETVRLTDLWGALEATDFDPELREAFHRAAHDIKGQAATLGYPQAGRVAASLCRLLECIDAPSRLPRDLLRQEVQAIRAILAEQARENTNEIARQLADRLDEVTEDYLTQIGVAA